MKIRSIISYCLVFCYLPSGCGLTRPINFDFGEVSKGVYHNEYFGFTMAAPSEEWLFKSAEDMKSLTAETADELAGDDLERKAIMTAGRIRSATILHLIKYQPSFNPNINLKVDNLQIYDNIDLDSYFDINLKTAEKFDVQYELLDEEYAAEKISGKQFKYLNVITHWDGFEIPQTIYITEQNNFCFIFTLTYETDAQKQELLEILRSAEFEDMEGQD